MRKILISSLKLSWIGLILVIFSSLGHAQFENGSVVGTIHDSSGAAIPGAPTLRSQIRRREFRASSPAMAVVIMRLFHCAWARTPSAPQLRALRRPLLRILRL